MEFPAPVGAGRSLRLAETPVYPSRHFALTSFLMLKVTRGADLARQVDLCNDVER